MPPRPCREQADTHARSELTRTHSPLPFMHSSTAPYLHSQATHGTTKRSPRRLWLPSNTCVHRHDRTSSTCYRPGRSLPLLLLDSDYDVASQSTASSPNCMLDVHPRPSASAADKIPVRALSHLNLSHFVSIHSSHPPRDK
jgi:hypothetical protein